MLDLQHPKIHSIQVIGPGVKLAGILIITLKEEIPLLAI